MNDDFLEFEQDTSQEPHHWHSWIPNGSLFDNLRHLWQWDGLAAEIGQESQSRIAFVGLTGAGKSLLFNRLRGWAISGQDEPVTYDTFELAADIKLESLGVFVLGDFPPRPPETNLSGYELTTMLSDPALVVYLLDGTVGVTAADYRWVAALRASGKPLLTVLNKCDLVKDVPEATTKASQKLGMPVIPISALTGEDVEAQLLPTMLDTVPRLAVPLGRELLGLRRQAARRVIRQSALMVGFVGLQPIPLLDLPFQVMIQVGIVMRVGAAYGYMPTGSLNREVLGTIASTLGARYLALSLVKLIPFLGWALAGVFSWVLAFLVGEAAIRYYEAGATIPLKELIDSSKGRLQAKRHRTVSGLKRRWLRRQWATAVPASQENKVPTLYEDVIIPVYEEKSDES